MSVVVLASHLPGRGRFRSARYRTVGIPCIGHMDYSHGWRLFWDSNYTICNVEHDMECSDSLIAELLECREPMCTWAYMLHNLGHYAHRTGKKPPCGGDWIDAGVEWADYGGIGLCKIAPEARVRPLAECAWDAVDIGISHATDLKWHVHWREAPDGPEGVGHYHR